MSDTHNRIGNKSNPGQNILKQKRTMKLKFDNRKIADTCTFIAYCLIILMSALGIVAVADLLFGWDILSGNIEKLAYLIMFTSMIIILGAFLISLMVNMNIISHGVENIAKEKNSKKDYE